ncbi:MAG TPA: dihydrofolate reductase family protein [Candidatus Limnocylindria bacterium]|jgi:class 3 adenylate cyclase/dihydrofolate reductase
MRLIATSFVTVDGVMEGPGFDEHRDGKNAWALRIQDEDTERYNVELLFGADAILLGRTTYQIWAAFWPTLKTGDAPMAERINAMPKYVASNTLERADWNNTTILRGDVAAEITRLKEQPGGELLLYGSADLLAEVMKHDLVDEYRLLLYPVVLGSGKHLFHDRIDTHHLRLASSRVFTSGVVLLVYEPDASAPSGPFAEEYTWTDEQVRSLQAAQNADRILATVLFTDIVESTAKAAEVGDRAWRQLIDRYLRLAQTEVNRWMGQHVESTGDGIMATFDTPTRALRCAFGLHDAIHGLGLEMRAAIHTGEIERREGGYGGIGVHIAARVMSHAGADQVVVTRTVRDLATGTDLAFAPMGSVSLRGVPGDWELFQASIR